ncbi:hypothetical protein [Tolypothrix sp. VBCCA 56010]|uniref:hypothetical protein n=1 Tax=Tolypothrix sp. VBCCA 56010 TaxID=3137731 RepID=UPI003D7EFC9F
MSGFPGNQSTCRRRSRQPCICRGSPHSLLPQGFPGSLCTCGRTHFHRGNNSRLRPKNVIKDLMRDYQQLTRELMIFGCHLHVDISDPEMAIA